MQGKVFDRIHGQPTTKSTNTMDLQMAKVGAAVLTTAWGGKHGCLVLVLTDTPYQTATNIQISTNEVQEDAPVSQAITPTSILKDIEDAKETHTKDDTALKIQEVTKRYGVDMIIAAMDPQ